VRITTIYEGTTGIQSNDLIGRKLGRDKGAAMGALISAMSRELQQLKPKDVSAAATCAAALEAVGFLKDATESLLRNLASRPELALAVSVPYLKLTGYTVAGWLMAKSAAVAAEQTGDAEFYCAKLRTAVFFAEQMLPNALALGRIVQRGAASVVETDAQLI
jgi:hypothetical protein